MAEGQRQAAVERAYLNQHLDGRHVCCMAIDGIIKAKMCTSNSSRLARFYDCNRLL